MQDVWGSPTTRNIGAHRGAPTPGIGKNIVKEKVLLMGTLGKNYHLTLAVRGLPRLPAKSLRTTDPPPIYVLQISSFIFYFGVQICSPQFLMFFSLVCILNVASGDIMLNKRRMFSLLSRRRAWHRSLRNEGRPLCYKNNVFCTASSGLAASLSSSSDLTRTNI